MFRELLRNPLGLAGGLVVLLLIIVAVFAPYLAPYDPLAINVEAVLSPPSFAHPCGTDLLGRDVLSRLVYGARVSLEVGVIAVGISLAIGVVLGALAGYYGGFVDNIISRFIDIMLCFPSIFLILAVIAYLEPSIVNIMIVIGLTSWMGVARLVRAEFLSLKEREFVLAEKALGANNWRIIFFHILPNALPPILVSATLGVGSAILVESALSFLGLGVQPPMPSWGNMLTEGKETLDIAWWLSVFPGMAILITVLAFNLLGEAIQEATDPRRQKR
ncbi:binding-protein-dependent transport systems inner membrane component [Thermodesulfatator indicus DSM 15286]|uniref:Binding-protein-dependent transport systems inner membrane component n=1 Tax=Thermodesulfatator indicus (strain DSM 15286 / JCM 11887 / CIR29812) TaxID=667014 RepID=F8A8V7_THEID|nr:ABC transporter permease [Thermodesulfatator indicus]AEH44004.1 binding-protein-dependent transport systems inner membrane component [Thermodesulfatator indicus DSM 15286]